MKHIKIFKIIVDYIYKIYKNIKKIIKDNKMKHIKAFKKIADYIVYKSDLERFITPNVSFIEETTGVEYNPYVIPHDYVDLGLPSGTKWATMNVGATSETDYGLYFSWGNIDGHAKDSGDELSQTTYNGTSGATLSSNIAADSGYDAARENWGAPWRLPTIAEFKELYNNCTWTWETLNGINGYRVTSKVEGYTSNSIFIPAAGLYNETSPYAEGSYGNYWSSITVDGYDDDYAYYLQFNEYDVDPQNNSNRRNGFSIRAVQ